jgi:hypothetical protein
MDLMLDINISIYPVKVRSAASSSTQRASSVCQHTLHARLQVGEKFSLALAPTINLDNTPTDGTYNAVRATKLRLDLAQQASACAKAPLCCMLVAGDAEHPQHAHGHL